MRRKGAVQHIYFIMKSGWSIVIIWEVSETLHSPMDCSLPGSSVHRRILQARILEWVAISFSRGSFRPRDWTRSPAFQADSLPFEPPGKPVEDTGRIIIPASQGQSLSLSFCLCLCLSTYTHTYEHTHTHQSPVFVLLPVYRHWDGSEFEVVPVRSWAWSSLFCV